MKISKSASALVFIIALSVFGLIGCGEQPGHGAATSFKSPGTPTTISSVTGEVSVLKAGTSTWTAAAPGMSLEENDHIRTGPGSNAIITFFEGSTIELAANTEIGVSELGIAEAGNSTLIKLQQEIGTTRSRVEKLVDPASNYEIETPAGAAVVRGSVGDVEVDNDGTTKITNIEGRWCGIGQGKEVCIPTGYYIIIVPSHVPSTPKPVPLPPILPPHEVINQPSSSASSARSAAPPVIIQVSPPLPTSVPQLPLQTWTQTTVEDFDGGTTENVTVVDVGGGNGTVMLLISKGVESTICYPTGTLESSSHDCGHAAVFGTISWDGDTPGLTELKFQIATNSDNSTWNFVGPDGSPTTYYETSGTNIWPGHNGNRYIKYKAFLSTVILCETPELEEVRITFR
jgi:hypothetical protein